LDTPSYGVSMTVTFFPMPIVYIFFLYIHERGLIRICDYHI